VKEISSGFAPGCRGKMPIKAGWRENEKAGFGPLFDSGGMQRIAIIRGLGPLLIR
jgi:hypothetical protein